MSKLSSDAAAHALIQVIGQSRWEAVTLAHGYTALKKGEDPDDVARMMYERGPFTLTKSKQQLVPAMQSKGFLHLLQARKKTGSAENPVTKFFPATVTEQRFLESLRRLAKRATNVKHEDERETRHSLVDFAVVQQSNRLPINVKNAGTRFEEALKFVGLEPDDCVPIPAYKAHGALEKEPNLLYAVSVDYKLVKRLERSLTNLFSPEEAIVWRLLNKHSGPLFTDAEDRFIFSTTRKYWRKLKPIAGNSPFNVISARKAIRILHKNPQRTPGIGQKAWGTAARGEINVHVSIKNDMTPWEDVYNTIMRSGIPGITAGINVKRRLTTFDPKI